MQLRRRWILLAFLIGACLAAAGPAIAEDPLETLANHEVKNDGEATVARVFDTGIGQGGENRAEADRSVIAIVNAHSGGNRDRSRYGHWLARQKPDLALVSEAAYVGATLRPVGRLFDAGNATRGQREVAIVVRDGQRVFGHDFGKVSPDLGTGIAHDRWWTRVETKVAGLKTRVYSLHLNAVIQQKDGRPYASRRWDVTREALEDLEKRWKEDIKDGWPVVIGGDFNWNNGRDHARAHEMAPGRILERLGMAFVNTELMWLAWTPKTHAIAGRRSVPSTSIPGLYAGEHPALFITLRARGASAGVQPDDDDKKQDGNGSGKDGDKNGGKNDGKDDSKNPSADDGKKDGAVKTADEIIQGFLERIQKLIDRVTQALKKITSLLSDTRRR